MLGLMRYVRREYNMWLCAGDFNKVLHASEKIGGNERQEWMMQGFRDSIDHYRFEDMGYCGLPYTWDNRQQGDRNIKVWLDRALGDDKFMECFDNSVVKHIQCNESDHVVVISARRLEWIEEGRGDRPFCFENTWTLHDQYN